MRFKLKLHSFKRGLEERQAGLRETSFDDFTKLYKRVLKRIPDISHLKNIVLFSGLSTLIIFILFVQRFAALNEHLPTKPDFGGVYSEGVQGDIKQLSPLYSPINNAETSATSLIFSGLTKRTNGGKIEPDLAESWEISQDNKTYIFHLRKNVLWHDGTPFSAADVIFTYNKIQDPDVGSAYFSTWKGVEISQKDDWTVVFVLPDPYAYFLSQTNTPIIPRHILGSIPSASLASAKFSKAPVGTGPYAFDELKELKSHQEVWLVANENYYGQVPHIEKVAIKAYKNYWAVSEAYRYRSVMAIERLSSGDIDSSRSLPNIVAYDLAIPEYDSLIFNLRSGLTQDKALREAISLSVDREEIIEEVYRGWATPVYSVILPGATGYNNQLRVKPDTNAAAQKLAGAGYVKNAEGKLTKNNQISELRIVTDDTELKKVEAEIIAARLTELGFSVAIEKYPFNTFIEDYVRTRNYDLLLISQSTGPDTDLYSYFHSNMKDDPGLNFSGFGTREVDKYIEEARNSHDPVIRDAKYQSIAKILAAEVPVVNICRPSYVFGASREIQGIRDMKLVEPRDKYTRIFDWYIKEVRDY